MSMFCFRNFLLVSTASLVVISWVVSPKQLYNVLVSTVAADLSKINKLELSFSTEYFPRRRLDDIEAPSPETTIRYIFTNWRKSSAKSPILGKQRDTLKKEFGSNTVVFANSTEQQHSFLLEQPCVDGAARRFDVLVKSNLSHLAEELWKYCALFHYGGMYIDSKSPILNLSSLKRLLSPGVEGDRAQTSLSGMAVLTDSFAPSSIHGSLIFFNHSKSKVALGAATELVTADISELTSSPLLLARALYRLIMEEVSELNKNNNIETNLLRGGRNGDWYLLEESCSENPLRKYRESSTPTKLATIRSAYTCTRESGICCLIYSGDEREKDRIAVLGTRNSIQPVHKIPYHSLPRPFHRGHDQGRASSFVQEDTPFISTIRSAARTKEVAGGSLIPTFYEQLEKKKCLPSLNCNKCLSDKRHGATCETCLEACPCFCEALCEKGSSTEALPTFQEFIVRGPTHKRDPTRLIPRIVFQTWFEDLDPKKYPNMSRLTESFKTSGWEYQFYTDELAAEFLDEHFPPQVRDAYDSLIPGAFKADLFRYCVLFIRGGVYADVDTIMGPSIDAAIPEDAGFMVGLDEPGKKIQKRMCLWNGFIASAPGHPFLAKVIETAVNNIHQRFTSVDIARMHCPSPEMSIITSFSPLFVAGPCMLGSAINTFLGKHGQAQFQAGELAHPTRLKIPGRTIILNQNKVRTSTDMKKKHSIS